MRIYNTLTKQKDEVKKPLVKKLRLFVCGPTVYGEPHIGNARTFVVFDILVKYLRSMGYKIEYLMNITDIDDKIIQRAKEGGIDPVEFARKYEQVFLRNMKSLGVDSVSTYARSTEFIPQVVSQVQALIKRGGAYEIKDDGWYFDLTTFENYGKLSNRTVEQGDDGVSRIDDSDKKRNKGDFCLWKQATAPKDLPTLIQNHHSSGYKLIDGEPAWQTKLGWGRPGWHIEDTAITEHFFGAQYDIHGGAMDLKFPHHEAEIALQESISRKSPLAKYWIHAGFLTNAGEKMSKSRDNFVTINKMLELYSGDAFRMFVLMHHYRSPVDYSGESMKTAQKHINDIGAFLQRLKMIGKENGDFNVDVSVAKSDFNNWLSDDFNTPAGLAVIFELMNKVNANMSSLSRSSAEAVSEFISSAFKNFGFSTFGVVVPEEVSALVEERELLRANKQFTQSDDLRNKILELGYEVEDTPSGPLVRAKE